MPLLTPSDVHLDTPLTNLTVAYAQETEGFVAEKIFPVVSVQKQSDKYYIYDREGLRSGDVKVLAPRTEVERVGMSVSNDNYFADVRGLGMDFDEQTLANEDTMLEIRSQGANVLMEKILIDRESRWVSNFFGASIWTTDWTGVAGAPSTNEFRQWSDYTNSTPIEDITNAHRTFKLASGGYKANKMVVDQETRDKLVNHPDILARLNGGSTVTNTALITNAKLAEIFDVESFYVMDAIQNTAKEGLADARSFIAGNGVLLTHTPASMGLMTPAAGAIFAWDSIPSVSNRGITVQSYSDDALKRVGVEEHIQVKCADDMKVVGADMGMFFASPIA
tara:strand:+ start:153 stop:1157 length:1005 start_codon:yes stop_codon:yes gene_type:complete